MQKREMVAEKISKQESEQIFVFTIENRTNVWYYMSKGGAV